MKHDSGNGRPTVVNLAPCTVVLMLAANSTMAQPHTAEAPNQVSDELKARIESAGAPAGIVVGWEMVLARRALPAFYSGRDYRPAWSAQQGPLPRAHQLVNSIRTASQHGLDPNDYHLQSIEELLRRAETSRGTRSTLEPAELADL